MNGLPQAVRLALYLVLTLVNISSYYWRSSISPWYEHLYLYHTMPNWVTWIRHKQGIYFNRKFTADIFIYLVVHVGLAPPATAWGLRVRLIIKHEWDRFSKQFHCTVEEYQTLVVARLFGMFRQLPVIENESDKKLKENVVHSSLLQWCIW